jgi:hypothetical protein
MEKLACSVSRTELISSKERMLGVPPPKYTVSISCPWKKFFSSKISFFIALTISSFDRREVVK